ncbi:sugar phosphate isomerase/epimerase family protein [Paenibacillus bouchesdurhonensis]|uniref:sugar phosphate isomerase/epimerase family protein n=1 Tax=Paenibacillus bouchesdurhonensis TaxID=1870990 RepID=UPI000DA615F4|nr:sugar phosphate isomerase/epimerase family protein [Paenibacillus bouchesdurhonensis]
MTGNNSEQASIQFSICTTGLKSSRIEDILAEAKRLGLHGVEIWSGHIEEYLNQGGTLSELRAMLDINQLHVPSLSEYSYFTKSKEAYQADLISLQRSAEWAKALECPRIRTFAGHVSSREATNVHWEMAAAGLREALQCCGSQGVALAVEIHNNTLADRADSLNKLLLGCRDGTLFEFIYDGFNLFVDHIDPIPILEQFYPFINHVHFKDYHWNHDHWGRSKPVSVLQGDAGHSAILDTLLALQYKGFISFEYFGSQVAVLTEQSLGEVTEYLKRRVIRLD